MSLRAWETEGRSGHLLGTKETRKNNCAAPDVARTLSSNHMLENAEPNY